MKTTKRTELKYELRAGDRAELLDTAKAMFEIYQLRQAFSEFTPSELTQPETEAYNAALGYLKRSFSAGHSQPDTPLVSSTEEVSIETSDSPNAINPYW